MNFVTEVVSEEETDPIGVTMVVEIIGTGNSEVHRVGGHDLTLRSGKGSVLDHHHDLALDLEVTPLETDGILAVVLLPGTLQPLTLNFLQNYVLDCY